MAAFGRQYLVETEGSELFLCFTRGKRSDVACGDRVSFAVTGEGGGAKNQGVIDSVAPRASLFRRAAAHRTKLIAANATQIGLVVAGEPSFSDELLCRALAAAEREGLRAFLALNKTDLGAAADAARLRLAPFAQAGYEVLELSAQNDVTPLRDRLEGATTVLLGQSGMGKSTIVNALAPEAGAATREISRFLDSGKHTTTHARLYRLDAQTTLIDTPGLQEFGLAHLTRAEIEAGFVEVRPYLGHCRFPDCRHMTEPDCALREAVMAGHVHPRRFELMQRILAAEDAAAVFGKAAR